MKQALQVIFVLVNVWMILAMLFVDHWLVWVAWLVLMVIEYFLYRKGVI